MFNHETIVLYRRLLTYILPFKVMIGITLLAIITIAAMEPAIAMVFKKLMDESLIAQDPDSFVLVPLMLAGVFTIKGVAEYFSKVFSQWIAQKAVLAIREDMYSKMQHLPFSTFQSYGTGKMMSKITYDVPQASNALSNAWVILIRDTLTIIGLFAYLLFISWQLTMMLIIIGPIVAFIIDKASKLMRHSSKAMQQNMGQLTERLEESLTGHQDIKIFGAEPYEQKRFQDTATELLNNTMRVTKVSALNVPLVQVLAAIALSFIVYLAMNMSADGAFTPGELLAYIIAMGLIFEPLRRLTSVNEIIQKGMAAAESIFELLDQPSETNEGSKTLSPLKGALSFEQVTFQYPNSDQPALTEFSLHFPAGKTTALVGPSGSGKSTLVNLIARFYDATAGEILLDGTNIQALERHFLRSNIALVSQKVTLFNDTVSANIAYGQKDTPQEDIIRAAKAAHAWEFIEKLPQGLQTNIGENGNLLSGGQRQRLAIARAFLKDAPILMFDEATSALDNQSEQLIQQAMEALKKNRTVIVIAHRLSTIEHADNIAVLQSGQLVEQGTHTELLNYNRVYAALHNQGKTFDE